MCIRKPLIAYLDFRPVQPEIGRCNLMGKIGITELILRDAHQSIFATRMRTEDMEPILEKMDKVGYWAVEMWGGATFDVPLRFLNQNPAAWT